MKIAGILRSGGCTFTQHFNMFFWCDSQADFRCVYLSGIVSVITAVDVFEKFQFRQCAIAHDLT